MSIDTFLSGVWDSLWSSTTEFTADAIARQITDVRQRLGDRTPPNSTVRLWVEAGSSYGHQSSTANLLYRIARPAGAQGLNLGFTGTIEVYYEADSDLPKLYALIPELGGRPQGPVEKAQVSLIKYTVVPTTTVSFGFTGGASAATTPAHKNYAAKLNVTSFLRLQPYNWPGVEAIEFLDDRPPVDLTAVPATGAAKFARRLYYIDTSMYSAPSWDAFQAGPATDYDKEKAQTVRWLFDDAQLANYQLQAAYSIKTGSLRFNQVTPFAAAVVTAGLLEWQQGGTRRYRKAKPAIVVNFDEFGEADNSAEPDLRAILDGDFARDEAMFQQMVEQFRRPDDVANFTRRRNYFRALDGNPRVTYLNYPQTLDEVKHAVGLLAGKNDEVLFVQLGRSFPAAFSYALYKSTLPPLFEGQNTANDAVNIGRPYLQVPATNAGQDAKLRIYPSLTLAQYAAGKVPDLMLRTAGQISSSPLTWPEISYNAPPILLGIFYQLYTEEQPATGQIGQYFRQLNTFFASPSQDKFLVALAYLSSKLPPLQRLGQLAATTTRGSVATLADEPDPLDGLWDKLNAAVKAGGPVPLVPGILSSGAISDFLQAFLKPYGGGLTLTGAALDPAVKPSPITTITLTGTTDVFASLGVKNTVKIVFTAPGGALTANFRFTANEQWSMPDAPWMAFDRPFIELTLPNSSLPVQATIGGYYPALEQADPPIVAKLEISAGGAEGRWPASIEFEPPVYPSITAAYQMATGFNLLQSLPAPFNAAADLGIKSVEVDYDYDASNVESVAIIAHSNTPGLELIGALTLENLQVTAVVIDPTRSRTLSLGVSAEFGIGTGENRAVVSVAISYPDAVLKGALVSGTPTFTDLIATFVPALTGITLPHEPTLEKFDLIYNHSTDYLSVSTELVMPGWDFTFPLFATPLFSLDRVEFSISRAKGINTGSITAHTTLLPKSKEPIGVDIGGKYLANKDLQLFARTDKTTVIDIDTLVGEYLGEAWMPTSVSLPKLADVGVTLLWGPGTEGGSSKAKSFEFKARTAKPWQPITALGDELEVTANLTLGYKGPSESAPELAGAVADPAVAVIEGHVVGGPPPAVTRPVVAAVPGGAYGKLAADVTLWFIHLKVEFDFDPKVQKVCVTWIDVGLKACLTTTTGGDQVATFTLEDQTVGSIIETFVSWATGTKFGLMAPFDILDDISLSGLKITYNFTKKKVDFTIDIGPINLGLFKINGISLAYNPEGNPDGKGGTTGNKVAITVDGSFAWQEGEDLSWEPDDPSTTPAPPGGGNKYFDLRLLALGQHVTVPGLLEETNVDGVIEKLEGLDIPKPPEIPVGGANQPTFDPTSSWFVAFDFGVLKVEKNANSGDDALSGEVLPALAGDDPVQYFISLGIVFNDPHLYALRIGLDGPMAKVFAGLDFQIMYQQVSQNVGRYSAQLALPTIMRTFQIGVASITLPTFAIEVYTNGDFQVDLGFPWNEDFTRSFSIEVQAGPLPVVGSAGFYFGKLSSATTNKVPQHTRPGWFNPVIVFGFGAQIGLGKSIEAGILSAGFSVTVFGIIEGVIARWQPYGEVTPAGDKNELQDGYYFSLTGTFGLQGRLYGAINFAIISAELDVKISLYVRITFASYEPIPITAKASVSVTLTVKINLGLFKISIHLSFKASVEVTFVLDNPMGDPSKAPWAPLGTGAGTPSAGSRQLAARGLARTSARDRSIALLGAVGEAASEFIPIWSNLQGGTKLNLQGWVAPALSVAGDIATAPADQQVVYVLNFFIDGGPAPIHAAPSSAPLQSAPDGVHLVAAEHVANAALDRARVPKLRAAAGDAPADTFQDLAIRVLKWVIAAGQRDPSDPTKGIVLTPDQVDALVVTDDYLAGALSYLSGATTPTPVGSGSIAAFLKAQASILFSLEQDAGAGGEPANAVFFPAAPGIALNVPAFGGLGPFDYSFGGYNSSSPGYLGQLNTYFNALKVQAAAQAPPSLTAGNDGGTGPSIASYIFGDYFAMIGRQTIQALRDGLRNFKLVVGDYAGKPTQAIIDGINTNGDLIGDEAYTLAELFAANQNHPLDPAAVGSGGAAGVAITGMVWPTTGGQSITAIAALPVFAGSFTATALALANADSATIIAPGLTITASSDSYRTQNTDSLASIAVALGFVDSSRNPDVAALLAGVPELLSDAALLAPRANLAVPEFRHAVVTADTLQSVATQYGVTLDDLAAANAAVVHLFAGDAKNVNLDVPHLPQYNVGELIDELRRTLALQHAGAMASRYYLHGLRLPTAFPGDGLTPNVNGLFVEAGGSYPADLGLFALTGQTIPLGTIPDPASKPDGDPYYTFTVDGSSEPWLSLGTAGTSSVTFTLNNEDDYVRYSEVNAVASAYLQTGSRGVGPIDTVGVKPRRFPLSTEIPWQPAVDLTLPVQPAPPTTSKPRLWSLPDELVNIPDGGPVRPTIAPLIARSDEATGTTVDEALGNYGLGTLISFTVRRLSTAASGLTGRTYEIVGAPESEITLLERLLDQLTSDSSSFDQVNLFYSPSSTGSQAAGWQSDDPASSLMGITQTNLSTETRPPAGVGAQLMAGARQPFPNLIGTPNEFLRLLWEASITRQGGFYLGYTTGIGGDLKGLPDHAFNDRGEAKLAVLAIFEAGSDQGQALGNYMNVAVTNEPFDLSSAALVAGAVPVKVDAPRAFASTDTLSSYAASYYTDPGVLAAANATVSFAPGVTLTVPGGLYQVPPNPTGSPTAQSPGADLALIGTYFGTTAAAIQAVNAAQLPATLLPLTAIKLPTVTVSSDGKSLQALSDFYGTPVAEIAAANLTVAGLYPAAPLTVSTGPASLSPLVRRGVAGMQLQRTAPTVPDAPGGNWGTEYLLQNFSLLGYRVASNNGNDYFPQSNWGLPSGPVDPDAAAGADKVQAPQAAGPGDTWDFTFSVPYASVLAAGDASVSPYAGVGDILQFEFVWLDLFGNKILSDLADPAPSVGTPLQKQPQLPGYTDALVGIGQWPAVANTYRVTAGNDGAPSLTLDLDFDPSTYIAAAKAIGGGDPSAAEAGQQKLDQAIAAYTLIAEQLADPAEVTIELTTSITPGATWTLPGADAANPAVGAAGGLRAWGESILAYLQALAGAPTTTPPAGFESVFALDPTAISTDQIFQLETTVTVRRPTQLVAGALATVSGITAAPTTVAPFTGSLTTGGDDAQPQRTLAAFAIDFTAAFAHLDGITLRIASGTDRQQVSATSPLWVVQLGTGAGQPISFTKQEGAEPVVYAPRPISNVLQSRAATPIIQYTTGSVIQLDGASRDLAFTGIDLDQWMEATLGAIDELFTPPYVTAADILRRNIEHVAPAGSWPNALADLVAAKKKLADNLRGVMIPVFKGQAPRDAQLGDMREAFYQTLLATLSGFYDVKAGIQFTADVDAAIAREPDAVHVPRVFGHMVATTSGEGAAPAGNALSLSSPKLDLEFADGSGEPSPYLSSLLSVTAVDAKCLSLDLNYKARYIEHEIGELAGIQGYEPSSWLSFVDIGDGASPFDVPLGSLDVPIVLREFPATPMLVGQDEVELGGTGTAAVAPSAPATSLAAGDCARTGTYDPLASATRWNYAFTYSMQVHYQQDEIHAMVSFNIAARSGLSSDAVPARDIFDNLAQFTQVYPQVQADLKAYLLPIDVGTTDETQLKNAQAAVESAAAMIDWLATSPPQLAETSHPVSGATQAGSVDFTISEGDAALGGVDALIVTVATAAALPVGVGDPQITVDGYTAELQPGGNATTWVYAYTSAPGVYLPASTGRSIAARTFVLPGLDILDRQNAQTALYITRNADVVPGESIADAFVYTTPTVTFEAPLHPTLVVGETIDLATIYSTGPTDQVVRPLECQLGLLYDALFEHAGTADVTMQASLYYEYEINAEIAKVRLPVYLMPPTKVQLRDGGSGELLASVIATQVAGWTAWFEANTPQVLGGALALDLTVMSDLAGRPMPLLQLTGLQISYSDLS